MTKSEAIELIRDFCEEHGFDFREEYSGRGMYGDTCIGIVCGYPLDVVMEICDLLHNEGCDSVMELLGSPEMDSMGFEKILYFKELTSDDVEDEDEDDCMDDEEEEDEQ